MVASSNQQETVMDTQKVETGALSDDQLDAVSGGTTISEQAKINALENAQQAAGDKKAGDQIKAFQQMLQEI
jgi:transcriptional regulator of nitric oxide reductase